MWPMFVFMLISTILSGKEENISLHALFRSGSLSVIYIYIKVKTIVDDALIYLWYLK